MLKFDGEVKQDYRGLCLCKPCWDGRHFEPKMSRKKCAQHKKAKTEDTEGCPNCKWVKTSEKVCVCLLGLCDCPCSQMQDDKQEILRSAKAVRIAARAAQRDMSEFGTIEIK